MFALIFFAALLGCAGEKVSSPPPAASTVESPIPEAKLHEVLPVSEVAARELLDTMFREAGMRVLNDVSIELGSIEVTLDGFDPQRGVGYEYIAPQEDEVDLPNVPELKILVLSGASREQLRAQAEAFLLSL